MHIRRARGTCRNYSDIDIALSRDHQPLGSRILGQIGLVREHVEQDGARIDRLAAPPEHGHRVKERMRQA